MTTVEELQSMTHEDLVRRVQELEQDLKEVKEQSDMWLDSFTRLQARHESSINALDNIVKPVSYTHLTLPTICSV